MKSKQALADLWGVTRKSDSSSAVAQTPETAVPTRATPSRAGAKLRLVTTAVTLNPSVKRAHVCPPSVLRKTPSLL